MSGAEGVRRGEPVERLVLMGANQAKVYRDITYELSRGRYIKFILPQMRELEKGGITREGMIELGPDPKLTLKINITKSALFRFNEQMEAYNRFLIRQRSGGKPAEVLDELQRYIDSLILLGQVMTLLRLDEPGMILSTEAKPIINAILEEVSRRKGTLNSLLTSEEMAYPFSMEKQMRQQLGINP
jgi:hypothetical protein